MQFYPAPPLPDRHASRSVLLRRHRAWSTSRAEAPPSDEPIGDEEDEDVEDEEFEDEDLVVGALRRAALRDEAAATIAVGTLAVDGPRGDHPRPAFVRLLTTRGTLGVAAPPDRHDGASRERISAARPGPTVFTVDGRDADELVLIRLDSAPATIVRLALRAGERGPVDGTPSNSVQGTTETSVVDLAPGHYLLLCRVSGRLPSALFEQTSAVA